MTRFRSIAGAAALLALALAPEVLADTRILDNGLTGEGRATFRVDEYGRMFSGTYDPFGPLGAAAHTAGDNPLLFYNFGEDDAFKARLQFNTGGWATAGVASAILADQQTRNVLEAAVTDEDASHLVSTFGFAAPEGHAMRNVSVTLEQTVTNVAEGALLRRSYTFHNANEADLDLVMVLAADIDLDHPSFASNLGYHSADLPGTAPWPAALTVTSDASAQIGASLSATGGTLQGWRMVAAGSVGLENQGIYTSGPFTEAMLNDVFSRSGDPRNGWAAGNVTYADLDANGDGIGDQTGDYHGALQSKLLLGANGEATIAYDYLLFSPPLTVPEPAATLLLALGAAAFAVRRRRVWRTA